MFNYSTDLRPYLLPDFVQKKKETNGSQSFRLLFLPPRYLLTAWFCSNIPLVHTLSCPTSFKEKRNDFSPLFLPPRYLLSFVQIFNGITLFQALHTMHPPPAPPRTARPESSVPSLSRSVRSIAKDSSVPSLSLPYTPYSSNRTPFLPSHSVSSSCSK